MSPPVRSRYLVLHDYGTGGNWWWIIAETADEILETFAEVEVLTDDQHLAMVADWDLSEVDVDGPHPPGLDGLAAKRNEQRGRAGYGVLARRDGLVHLRRHEAAGGATWFTELQPGGRRTRQVRVDADGRRERFTEWPIDVPTDLRDPELAPHQISADDFERAWSA